MEQYINCFANAIENGPECPEWKYLYHDTIPMFEVKGYKIAKAIDMMLNGQRNKNELMKVSSNGCDDILNSILDAIEGGTYTPVSLFGFAICESINAGDTIKLENLLILGYPVNSVLTNVKTSSSRSGVTALHHAICFGSDAVVRILLQYGADYSVVDEDDVSPISMAISRDRYELVRYMTTTFTGTRKSLQESLNTVDCRGRHPLQYLFNSWTDEAVRLLQYFVGKMIYVEQKSFDDSIVKLMMHRLTDCIDPNIAVNSPLSFSALDIIHLLSSLSYDINRPFENMKTDDGLGGITPLFYACNCGNLSVVKLLLELGAVPDQCNDAGTYPIEMAINGTKKDEDIACALIEAGANPNREIGSSGSTVMLVAMVNRQWFRLGNLCLKKGGDPLLENKQGSNVLCLAAQDNLVQVIQLLRENYSNCTNYLNARQTRYDLWPLWMSVQRRHHSFTEELLAAGADPNLQSSSDNSRTCLHVAILEGDFYTVRMLVQAGANVDIKSTDRLSRPLDFAINQSHYDIAEYLVLHGSNPLQTLEDVKGSPQSIMYAEEEKQTMLRKAWLKYQECGITEGSLSTRHSEQTPVSRLPPISVPDAHSNSPKTRPGSAGSGKKSPREYGSSSGKPSGKRSPRISPKSPKSKQSQSTSQLGQPGSYGSMPGSGSVVNGASSLMTKYKTTDSSQSRFASDNLVANVSAIPTAATESVGSATSAPATNAVDFSSQDCCICFEKKRNASIIHGKTGHVCCCTQCASLLKDRGDPCPVCRQRIDMVVELFNS